MHLRRAFGFGRTEEFDPFLLLDDFRNDSPDAYLAGFPWHPHRGIETITYVLAGNVEHQDSLGNKGVLTPGDVQWMTAGRGIIHQEMPHGDQDGRMYGFQLWANLPSSLKMVPPHYQDRKSAEIPVVTEDDGTQARVICGDFWGAKGAVDGIAADPIYLDISVPPGKRRSIPVETSRHVFAYVFEGDGQFANSSASNRELILFDRGDEVVVQAGEKGIRFILVSGMPLQEPVAWRGPIVMNTTQQLSDAFRQLQQGTFLNAQ